MHTIKGRDGIYNSPHLLVGFETCTSTKTFLLCFLRNILDHLQVGIRAWSERSQDRDSQQHQISAKTVNRALNNLLVLTLLFVLDVWYQCQCQIWCPRSSGYICTGSSCSSPYRGDQGCYQKVSVQTQSFSQRENGVFYLLGIKMFSPYFVYSIRFPQTFLA